MFVFLSGELIAFLTFPGIVLHEVAHRLFCDWAHIEVYSVSYFNLSQKTVGHVAHAVTNNIYYSFLIGVGPLIINTIVCMILTFPAGCKYYLDLDFFHPASGSIAFGYTVLTWIGYSVGFHAIPSNQDVKHLPLQAQSAVGKVFLCLLDGIVSLCHVRFIGWMLCAFYAYGISLILPWFFLKMAL